MFQVHTDIFVVSLGNSSRARCCVRVTLCNKDDTKIVRTPKNMAASVVNLPGMTLQPLYMCVHNNLHTKMAFSAIAILLSNA